MRNATLLSKDVAESGKFLSELGIFLILVNGLGHSQTDANWQVLVIQIQFFISLHTFPD